MSESIQSVDIKTFGSVGTWMFGVSVIVSITCVATVIIFIRSWGFLMIVIYRSSIHSR
jgi:hypothetical protein